MAGKNPAEGEPMPAIVIATIPPSRMGSHRNEMDFGLIVWIGVIWALGALVAVILLRMAGDQDRAARHMEKELSPFSDVTITRGGEG